MMWSEWIVLLQTDELILRARMSLGTPGLREIGVCIAGQSWHCWKVTTDEIETMRTRMRDVWRLT